MAENEIASAFVLAAGGLCVAPRSPRANVRDVARGDAETRGDLGRWLVGGADRANLRESQLRLAAALRVHGQRRDLEVSRVHAAAMRAFTSALARLTLVTKMVERLASVERADVARPNDAVRESVAEQAVAVGVRVACPDPASRIRELVERLDAFRLKARSMPVDVSLWLAANPALTCIRLDCYRRGFPAAACAESARRLWRRCGR